jgi:hypothetical protein
VCRGLRRNGRLHANVQHYLHYMRCRHGGGGRLKVLRGLRGRNKLRLGGGGGQLHALYAVRWRLRSNVRLHCHRQHGMRAVPQGPVCRRRLNVVLTVRAQYVRKRSRHRFVQRLHDLLGRTGTDYGLYIAERHGLRAMPPREIFLGRFSGLLAVRKCHLLVDRGFKHLHSMRDLQCGLLPVGALLCDFKSCVLAVPRRPVQRRRRDDVLVMHRRQHLLDRGRRSNMHELQRL